ncbi:MAG TPA: class I SAM-dependent methyltransferase, partial [Blastocatellia bacterium]|nr:class I SAM-dependent methyltransferase [Blastocatellia bacterium]
MALAKSKKLTSSGNLINTASFLVLDKCLLSGRKCCVTIRAFSPFLPKARIYTGVYIMSSIDQNQLSRELFDYAHEMKRDWDERARQNARWFINSGRHRQSAQIMPSEEELCAQGRDDSKHLLLDHLPLLLPGSDLKSLRIFEIGCGIGRMTQTLAENFSEVYATDISSEMLKLAHERLHNHKNVRLFETNGLNFADLPDNFFDVVFSAYV